MALEALPTVYRLPPLNGEIFPELSTFVHQIVRTPLEPPELLDGPMEAMHPGVASNLEIEEWLGVFELCRAWVVLAGRQLSEVIRVRGPVRLREFFGRYS